jgi:Double zinc ribbon
MTHAFTRNFRDHSNGTGFQFEFSCDKCGNGYRSSFSLNKLSIASSLLRAAGSLFGGTIQSAAHGSDYVKDAFRGPAWDTAFKEAIAEVRPRLRQCTRCGHWVCPEVCFNAERGLCETCAPDLKTEAASLQAQVAVEQAKDAIRGTDQIRGEDVAKAPAAAPGLCSKCSATLSPGAKFCASCGTRTGPATCVGCSSELAAGAKFCAQCGKAV